MTNFIQHRDYQCIVMYFLDGITLNLKFVYGFNIVSGYSFSLYDKLHVFSNFQAPVAYVIEKCVMIHNTSINELFIQLSQAVLI